MRWTRSTAVAVTGLVGVLMLLVGMILLPGAQPQPGSPGGGVGVGLWMALLLVAVGLALCVGCARRLNGRVVLAAAVTMVLVAGAILVGRHFTGREVPSVNTAQATVAQGVGTHADDVRCTRIHGQYWDYACTWVDGGRQTDSFRFDGARVVDDKRAWG